MVRVLQDLHTGTTASIRAFGGDSRPFEITGGVRQGCNIAPSLFNLFLDFVVKQAAAEFGPQSGVRISFSFQGQPLHADVGDLSHTTLMSMLLYADDMVLLAVTAQELRRFVLVLEAVTQRWGLCINAGKTKLWAMNADPTAMPHVTLRGTTLQAVDDFKYLGSTLSNTGSWDTEISTRLGKAASMFARLTPILLNRKASLLTRMHFYRAFIPSTLLYGCEAWPLTDQHVQKLHVLHMRLLRQMLGITRMHKLSNERILQICRVTSIRGLLLRARARWIGHVARMPEDRWPKQVLFGRLPAAGHPGRSVRGRRPRDPLRSSYADVVAILSEQGGGHFHARRGDGHTWWHKATDKGQWRAYIRQACVSHAG
jgi:hypothetical protein